jgi:hypothetical protein
MGYHGSRDKPGRETKTQSQIKKESTKISF